VFQGSHTGTLLFTSGGWLFQSHLGTLLGMFIKTYTHQTAATISSCHDVVTAATISSCHDVVTAATISSCHDVVAAATISSCHDVVAAATISSCHDVVAAATISSCHDVVTAATISSCHDVVAACSAVRRSPSPVRCPGVCCLATSETRRSVQTISGGCCGRICFGMHLDT